MAFLFPSFLWALTALAVPIIIHLFQLRRFKRIAFPNVRMLQEVSQRTRSRKQVKHWLVLFARLFALSCLVLAFAQPYLPSGGTKVKAGQRAVSLYVDDSWSMDGTNAQGRLLDQARKNAQDAIMAFKATDRFQVLTNSFEGRQATLLSRDEALQATGMAETGPFSRPLSQVITRQHEALGRSDAPVKRAFLFTDLQHSVCDVDAWRNDSTVRTTIVPLAPDNSDDLALDSVWFASPVRRLGQHEILHVRIRNHGARSFENVPLKLMLDGRQRALATFAVEAHASVDTVLRFTNDAVGAHWGEVSLNDRPITFDDDLFIAYRTAASLRVLLVTGEDEKSDRSIAAVFGADSVHTFSQQPYRRIDLGALARTDLLIMNAWPDVPSGSAAAIRDLVKSGGSVAVFPCKEPDMPSWSAFLKLFGCGLGARDTSTMRVDRIDLQEPFFSEVFTSMPKNVDLPLSNLRFDPSVPPAASTLLRMQNGRPFLCSVPVDRGLLYLCASPLNEAGSTFAQHALFVTSLLRMAELSRPMGTLYHTIGDDVTIALEGVDLESEAAPHLKGPGGADIVPEVRRLPGTTAIALHDMDLRPGPYALTSGADTLSIIALDLSRAESDLEHYTPDQLRQRLTEQGLSTFDVLDRNITDLGVSLKEMDQGTKLWKLFIALAIAFLIIEIMLIRGNR